MEVVVDHLVGLDSLTEEVIASAFLLDVDDGCRVGDDVLEIPHGLDGSHVGTRGLDVDLAVAVDDGDVAFGVDVLDPVVAVACVG